jgi:hypothetical protein
MKKAEGFITEDGTFFEREEEAELHEAEMRLRTKLGVEYPDLSQGKFFEIVTQLIGDVGAYINAYQTANKRDPAESEVGEEVRVSEPAKADDGLGHVSSTEKDLASLLKLPARGSEHVPDVGSGSWPEEVPDRRKKHGPRVRKHDA